MLNNKVSLLIVFVILFLGALNLPAQERAGGIEGTVRDPSGAVVPNTPVTIASVASSSGARPDVTIGFNRTVTTDDNGFFRVLEVPPGFYTVSVPASAGFSAATLNNVQVILG